MPITAFYAGLLAPLLVFLGLRVIGARRLARVPIGDGGDRSLLRAMRVHGNFTEYVPMALLLMALAESLATPALILHGLGLALVAGRLSHAYGLSQTDENFRFRTAGMGLTFTVIGIAGTACLLMALWRGLPLL